MSEFGKIMDEKCMAFAVRIVNLCRFLKKEGKDSKTLISSIVVGLVLVQILLKQNVLSVRMLSFPSCTYP